MKKRIDMNGVLCLLLVPFCVGVMNKYKVRSDGRPASERITGHKCRQQVIGFAESIDLILETHKNNMHKGDTRVKKGIFLGYIWRQKSTTETRRNVI